VLYASAACSTFGDHPVQRILHCPGSRSASGCGRWTPTVFPRFDKLQLRELLHE
jgi:hypothetical protein